MRCHDQPSNRVAFRVLETEDLDVEHQQVSTFRMRVIIQPDSTLNKPLFTGKDRQILNISEQHVRAPSALPSSDWSTRRRSMPATFRDPSVFGKTGW